MSTWDVVLVFVCPVYVSLFCCCCKSCVPHPAYESNSTGQLGDSNLNTHNGVKYASFIAFRAVTNWLKPEFIPSCWIMSASKCNLREEKNVLVRLQLFVVLGRAIGIWATYYEILTTTFSVTSTESWLSRSPTKEPTKVCMRSEAIITISPC